MTYRGDLVAKCLNNSGSIGDRQTSAEVGDADPAHFGQVQTASVWRTGPRPPPLMVTDQPASCSAVVRWQSIWLSHSRHM